MSQEKDIVPAGFRAAVDLDKVRLISRAHNIFARNKILVRGYDIYWPNTPSDFSREGLARQSVLIHELCHVWQYQTGRLTALSYLLKPTNWRYSYDFHSDKSFDDYPIEKQADLLQDWFLINEGARPCRFQGVIPSRAEINAVVPFGVEDIRYA